MRGILFIPLKTDCPSALSEAKPKITSKGVKGRRLLDLLWHSLFNNLSQREEGFKQVYNLPKSDYLKKPS